MKVPAIVLALGVTASSWGFDWGGSLEDNSWALVPTNSPSTGTINQIETARFWATIHYGREASLLFKGNISDSAVWAWGGGLRSNTFSFDLDSAVYAGHGWVIGRTTFQDFGGTVLNTDLDGIQYSSSIPGIDFTALLGTSLLVFKDQSTIVVSQNDINDRSVLQDWAHPSTLFAPPRAVGYFEADFNGLVPEQTFKTAQLVQYDFRWFNVATRGSDFDPTKANGPGAPVSIAYTGLGGTGRLWESIYWDAWAYIGYGWSLTPVGAYTPARTTPPVTAAVFPVWKDSYILNGIANLDVTWLVPQLSYSIFNIGIQAGSWDGDGISPDQNVASGSQPHLYTGYFGVSRTGSSLIFNPQPVNMVTTQLLYSVKPLIGLGGIWANVQTTFSTFVFVRPTEFGITESGLIAGSKERYLGTETDANVLFRFQSDWGGNLGMGLFFPNTKALTRKTEMKLQLGTNISF